MGAGAGRAPGHRLEPGRRCAGSPRGARPADVLRRAVMEPLPVRPFRARPAAGDDARLLGGVLRGARGRAGGGASRPDGLSQSRRRRPRRRVTPRRRAVCSPLRLPTGLLRGSRPRVEGRGRGAGALRPAGSRDRGARQWGAGRLERARGPRGGPHNRERGGAGLVRRGQRAAPQRGRGRTRRAAGDRARPAPAASVAVTAAAPWRWSAPEGGPASDGALWLGAVLGAP